jgi:dipeptidyl-peptidase-4
MIYRLIIVILLLGPNQLWAQKSIELKDIWYSNEFSTKGISGFRMMENGKQYLKLKTNDSTGVQYIMLYDLKTDKAVRELFNNSKLIQQDGKPLNISNFTLSKDESQLLIESNQRVQYRYSYFTDFYAIDIKTSQVLAVGNDVMYPEIAPNGKGVSYVRGNNLFYLNFNNGVEYAISRDGKKNHIINGAVDWVYEEEFQMSKGYFWNPEGTHIAWYRFDESEVKEFSMDIFQGLYTKQEVWKYPKAGEDNSVVQVFIYDLAKDTSILCNTGEEKDVYFPRIMWSSETGKLCIQRLNRKQNHLEFLLADAKTGETHLIYEEKNDYYLDITDNLAFIPGTKSFVFTSEKSGRNHVWLVDYNKKTELQLSQGQWDVDEFHGLDTKTGRIFFTSSANGSMNRDFRWVETNGKSGVFALEKNGWHSITMIKGFRYFIDNFSTVSSPPIISLYDMNIKRLKILEENQALREKLKAYRFSDVNFSCLDVNGEKISTWRINPSQMQSDRKYPVLQYVYGGPGSQTVVNRWTGAYYFWFQYLASKGYVVVSADNRGTGFMGEKFKKCTYLQLGNLEIQDQIGVAKLLSQDKNIDSSRIGMFGWSYGGYMSSLAITKGNETFKTAVAVAPVTNWRFYDNIYTERYMQKPQDNAAGYDDNSPINQVIKIKGNYLIVHGTADDNVHFQNAVEMIDAMIRANKKFDSEIYPNRNHGIGGGITRYHLFERISKFLIENL